MSDPDYTLPISKPGQSHHHSKAKYGYKALSHGDIIGKKYRIIKELGSGGFATTYLAEIVASKKQKCVLKQLQPRFNSPDIWENARERLDTEGMVLRWLGKHDQIPELVDHFDENGQFFLVLEFIEGEEFDREVQRNPLNETSTLLFLSDVLQILEFVHQQGVIHRDIKPSNLIRRNCDNKMTLIDFGAVKEIGTAMYETPQSTLQTQVIGTPGYMPPEQNNGKPVYSSDIYALGKTAIYGLTGRSPADWEESTSNGNSWTQSALVGRELALVISKMTAYHTGERYQSAKEVLEAITPLMKVGKTIGDRYQVLKYLGGEKQIDNYLVKDSQQERESLFYLKMFRPISEREADLERLHSDLQAEIAQIDEIAQKQNILKILDCFIHSNTVCLVQEYIPGNTIYQLLNNSKKPFSQEQTLDLIINTATVLSFCHKKQTIHGNIQPLSLLQKEDDNSIILKDFGNIHNLDRNFLNGNLGYVPPEQIAGRTTFASDIYALGMTAIHCLTGTSPQQLSISHKTGAILWEEQAVVDPAFSKIINKMVCLERKNRYSSINQVLKAVKAFKRKQQKKVSYSLLIGIPILLAVGIFVSAQWAQRAAISEFYLANIRVEKKQYRNAIRYYEEGIRKLPKTRRQVQNFEAAWLNKASIHNRLQEYQEALVTCEDALRYHQSYRLWNCKGLALHNLGKYEAAVTAYDRAIALEPDYVWSWNNRGDSYIKLDNVEAAVADLQQAIQLNPQQSHIPWNNLGKLYYQQRSYQDAIDAYQNAIAAKRDYLPSLIGLGNAYKSVGESQLAQDAYDRALESNPESHEAWFGKALISESMGRYTEAANFYEEALAIKPDWQAAIEGLARVENR